MICKCFLHAVGYLFALMVSFAAQGFTFDKVRFIYFFSFVAHDFGVILRNHCQKNYPFSYKSFINLVHIFLYI